LIFDLRIANCPGNERQSPQSFNSLYCVVERECKLAIPKVFGHCRGGLARSSFSSLLARAQFLKFFAMGGDLQTMRFRGKTQPVTDFILELLELLAVELHNLLAILANDMIVVRMFGVIWVIKFIILTKIHFPE